jgi:hypothetical protein
VYACPSYTTSVVGGGVASSPTTGGNVSTDCVCIGGYYMATSGSCVACPAGRYSATLGLNSSMQCTACPMGKYGSTTARTSVSQCTACPQGRWSNRTALSSSAACSVCPSHSNSPRGSVLLRACTCQRGYYDLDGSTLNESVSCTSCPPGRYNTHAAQAHLDNCTFCPSGRYRPTTGGFRVADCSLCAIGRFNELQGLSSASQCRLCPPAWPRAVTPTPWNLTARGTDPVSGAAAWRQDEGWCVGTSGSTHTGFGYTADCSKLFDNNVATSLYLSGTYGNHWVEFDFYAMVNLTGLKLRQYGDSSDIATMVLRSATSRGGSFSSALVTLSPSTGTDQVQTFSLSLGSLVRHLRIVITATSGGPSGLSANSKPREMQFLGPTSWCDDNTQFQDAQGRLCSYWQGNAARCDQASLCHIIEG